MGVGASFSRDNPHFGACIITTESRAHNYGIDIGCAATLPHRK